jgi:CRISPR-associated protein Csb3
MNHPKPSLSVLVDVTNPGQFFACCGLLELAHRLWPGAEGWFEGGRFLLAADRDNATLPQLRCHLQACQLVPERNHDDEKTCPLRLRPKAADDRENASLSLLLDWWRDDPGVGGSLKTWAGQQSVTVIGCAMLHSAVGDQVDERWLDMAKTASLPESPRKVVEPFYFDARRFANALDTGFSLDAQGAETAAYPAVEFLSLIGLQRFRPAPTDNRWTFKYWTWSQPLCAPVASAVACGALIVPGRRGYQFTLRFRDDQKRYKAFDLAIPLGDHS